MWGAVERKLLKELAILLLSSFLYASLGDEAGESVVGKYVPEGKGLLFFIGQTTPDLDDFKNEVLSNTDFPRPTGISLYTNIFPDQCSGIDGRCNINGNINDFNATLKVYPKADLNVGLYLSDTRRGCTNEPLRALMGRKDPDLKEGLGEKYRTELDDIIKFLKNTKRRVFLRIGYEFDGFWNCYHMPFHKEAFRYVKGRIDALGADNIATVWQSATYPIDGRADYNYNSSHPDHFDTWYPGDDVVDWVGMSMFFFSRSILKQVYCIQETVAPEVLYETLIDFARAHKKPVLIAEATPSAYRLDTLDVSCIVAKAPRRLPGGAEELWDDWYRSFFDYIQKNRSVIRGVSYINTNWETITEFTCAYGAVAGQSNCLAGYWGNSRIQDNPLIQDRFRDALRHLVSSEGVKP